MDSPSNNAAARSTSRSLDAVSPSDSIMMWGAKGSGKSVYIASLVYWSPPADAARRVCVLPANSTAAEWVADRVRSLAGGSGDRGLGNRPGTFRRRAAARVRRSILGESPVPSPRCL